MYRLPRAPRRALALGLPSVAALALALPGAAAAETDFNFYIDDGLSLGPSDVLPDRIYASASDPNPYGSGNSLSVIASVERGGAVIAASAYAYSELELPDLHDGDTIVLRDASKNTRPEVLRYTYRKSLHVDEPVCAGQTKYVGSRTPGSFTLYGSSALWQPGDNSWWYGSYGYYPGGAAGFYPTEGSLADVKAVGSDRFSFDAKRPTTDGMQLFVAESFVEDGNIHVSTRVEQKVVTCTPPVPGTTTPPATTPPIVKPPVVGTPDTKAPVVTVTGLKASTLKKLGLTKLLKKGLPVTLTLDEAGKVTAKITLVKGKKKTKLVTSTQAVGTGKNSLTFAFSKKAKKKITAAKKTGKLLIELTVTDAAGNKKVLPPVTVKVPK